MLKGFTKMKVKLRQILRRYFYHITKCIYKEPCNMQGQGKETKLLHIYCRSYLVFNRCVLSKYHFYIYSLYCFTFKNQWTCNDLHHFAVQKILKQFKQKSQIVVVEVHGLSYTSVKEVLFELVVFLFLSFLEGLVVKASAKMIMNYNSRLRQRPKRNITHFGVELEKQTLTCLFSSTFPHILRQGLEKFPYLFNF